MVPIVDKVARWSVAIIYLSPVIGIITRHPMPFSLLLILGLSGFIARMMIHALTLPIEFDAILMAIIDTDMQYIEHKIFGVVRTVSPLLIAALRP